MTQSRLLVLLVALDFVSKVAALLLLPEAHSVRSDAIFQFALQLNETGFGTWGRAYFGHVSLSDALVGTVGYLGLAIALIATRRRRLGLWRRGAIAVAAYLVVALPALPAAEALLKFSQPLSVVAVRVAAIAFIATIWWFLPAGLLKLALTLLLAAGIGNVLSFLYPPFRIVDFMYSRLATRALGYGVFNMADLYIPVGLLCLPVAAAQYCVRRFWPSRDATRAAP